jgi:hypothetical protein
MICYPVVLWSSRREWLESCTSGISSAQQLVDKAQVLQGGTQGVIVGDDAGTSRQPAHDGVNPNKNYFGNMWRDAFHKVGQKLRNHKLIRAQWQRYVVLYYLNPVKVLPCVCYFVITMC